MPDQDQKQKQTSTDRVKAHQARQKRLKQDLADKGYITINLIVKKDQDWKIENSAKMLKTSPQTLLYSITQRAIAEFCQKHDDILISNAQAEKEMQLAFAENNPDFANLITTKGKI